ncbi:MAG: hypothetical protein EOP00_21845, partial [Pedobacter sp.]
PPIVSIPNTKKTVKQFGAKGDGLNDDTDILQSIIDANEELVFDGGTYIINRTLNLKSGSKLTGLNGAIIKSGSSLTGTLSTFARFLNLSNVKDCTVSGLKFQSSSNNFKLSAWYNACLFVSNSTNNLIENNNFDFKLPFSLNGFEAVWVTGPETDKTTIKNNKIYTLGIKYAENGASGTIVESNVIVNAHSNALTANGNSAKIITGCKLLNNSIENTGRMAIEDWGAVDGTVISGNIIVGTGKGLDQAHDGLGISAVGTNSIVTKNKITDAKFFYIEIGGNHNCIVENNEIFDTENLATGIIFNYTDKMPANLTSSFAQAKNNIINGCQRGIYVFGINYSNCLISGNTLRNQSMRGVSVESDSKSYDIQIVSNTFYLTLPNSKIRTAVNSYNTLPVGSANQNLTVSKNIVNYAASAAGGVDKEYSFLLATDNVKVLDNEVFGNNIKSGGSNVFAISSNGAKSTNVTIGNNKIHGAILDLNNYSNPSLYNNSVN